MPGHEAERPVLLGVDLNRVGVPAEPGHQTGRIFQPQRHAAADEQPCCRWSVAINHASSSKVKDAAFAFLSYMSQPAQSSSDVTIGKTGFNPYRTSHFTNLGPWETSGMSEAAAKNYLGAIQSSLQSPNMVLDLRIPQTKIGRAHV